jgi:hypothetical protein
LGEVLACRDGDNVLEDVLGPELGHQVIAETTGVAANVAAPIADENA